MLKSVKKIFKTKPTFTGLIKQNPNYKEFLADCLQNPHVFIEICSICNFRCNYCNGYKSKRGKYMELSTFRHILDQVKEISSKPIYLHIYGEPTLHPNFLEMALEANNKGHKIILPSNGSLLKSDFLAIDMSLNVYFSTTADELAKRSKLNFEKYMNNLKEYIKSWKTSNSIQEINFFIYFDRNTIVNTELLSQKEEFLNTFCSELSLQKEDSIKIDSKIAADTVFSHTKDNGAKFEIKKTFIASGGLYPDTDGGAACRTLPSEFGFCDSPWKHLAILADGRVTYCCHDLNGDIAYTNNNEIMEKSLKDLWLNDSRINKIRENMLSGKIKHPTCQQCLDFFPKREFYVEWY